MFMQSFPAYETNKPYALQPSNYLTASKRILPNNLAIGWPTGHDPTLK